MLLSMLEKYQRREAFSVSLVLQCLLSVCLPDAESVSASPQTGHYKLIDCFWLPATGKCCRPCFYCVLVLPVSEADWQGHECRRWTLKNRNSVQRGKQVQKVIGNGRTGWYKKCEPESWNQFWMTYCFYPWHRQSWKQSCFYCRTDRVIWCGLWAASPALQGSGGSAGTNSVSVCVVPPLCRGFHHLCGVEGRAGWLLVLLSTPGHANEPLLQR